MLNRGMKIFVTLLGVIAGLILTSFIALSIFNSPTYAWRLLRYGQSDIGDSSIFPERAIASGETVSLIPRGYEGTPYEVEYPYMGKARKEVLGDL